MPIKDNNWKYVQHFKPKEFDDSNYPGSGKHIDAQTLLQLDKTRDEAGWPIIVHGAVDMKGEHGHAKYSYHLKKMGCKAVDFHFKTTAPLKVQFNYLCRMGWPGVGVYPEWNSPGFHVDSRPIEETEHWVCISGVYHLFFKHRI